MSNFCFLKPSSTYDANNAVVYVPKHTIALTLYRKKHKYVSSSKAMKKPKKGFMDKCMTVFRPETPPGMCRVVEKRQVGKWELTLYKKQRISVSLIRIIIQLG